MQKRVYTDKKDWKSNAERESVFPPCTALHTPTAVLSSPGEQGWALATWVCPPLTVWPGAGQVSAWCSGHRCWPCLFPGSSSWSAVGQAHTHRAAWEAPVPGALLWGRTGGQRPCSDLAWPLPSLPPGFLLPPVNPRHPNRCLWLCLGLPGSEVGDGPGYSGLPLQEGARSACGPAVSVHSWVLEASVCMPTFTVSPPPPPAPSNGKSSNETRNVTSGGGWCSPSPLPSTLPPSKAFLWGKGCSRC